MKKPASKIPKITIRKATIDDVPGLVPLWKQLMGYHVHLARKEPVRKALLAPHPDATTRWKRWIGKWIRSNLSGSRDGLVLIAESNGTIVGYSMNYTKENIRAYAVAKVGYMDDLFVLPAYRGRRITSRFRSLVFAWFRKKHIKYASIGVHPTNPKAHSIYRKWGFFDYHIEMRRRL